MRTAIHPSILSADFGNLREEILTVSTADALHVDVMDNHFVPNLTFGLPVVKRIVQITELPIDVHLMIENVDNYAVSYAEVGAASVTFHQEASADPIRLARRIREAGSLNAIAVKPATPLDYVLENLGEFDMILIMTVEPGFGGQVFLESTLEKISQVRSEIDLLDLEIRLQVDGGVNESTLALAAAVGADTFVSGSAIFNAQNRAKKIIDLRDLANGLKL